MPVAARAASMHATSRFAWWRIAVWLLLLFSAIGCLQYAHHARQLWAQLQTLSPTDSDGVAGLHGMLGWDGAYLLAAMLLIVLCAGGILRQAWARRSLRVACVLLAVWLLISGGLLLSQWDQFKQASEVAMTGAHVDAALQQWPGQAQRSYLIALILKALAVPVLLWLAWRLGQPTLRAQFRSRR